MLYIMCISVRLYVCFIKQVTVGWCTMVVFLCLCCLCCGNSLWAFLQSVVGILAIRQQPQGADLSCPHIRICHAFAIRSEDIHVMFATCSLSVCYIFAMQKYGFWRAKTPFLHCKNPLFEIPKWGSEFRAYTTILKHRMFFAATQMGGGYVKKMIR